MSFHTHITIADRGWILESLAREIAIRTDLVSYGTEPDPSADLHYYINYSCRRRRVGPVEIAFFTHSEKDPAARKRYFDIAADVEHSVCMSERYAKELVAAGVKNVTTITPGVDLETFTPKVRIGIVGRTYHTGRKGEALVADVMDIPGIEWRFTGEGWPGPSNFIEDGKMPDFYNDLDYVLIPALYEGGPMSVLEGLACGIPIISSQVGWVNEYPHIPFENGDSASLRAVLTRLVDERLKLRAAVEHRTWVAWGEGHLDLFEKVASQHGLIKAKGKKASKSKKKSVMPAPMLITHGGEGKTLGGPSVRVPRTAEELARIGVPAALPFETVGGTDTTDVAHVFNSWPPESAFNVLSDARKAGKTTVFSPIFLNLTHKLKYDSGLPQLIASNLNSPRAILAGLQGMQADILRADERPPVEPMAGYKNTLAACLNTSDHVIFLSEYEKRCVDNMLGMEMPSTKVCNPVDAKRFEGADAEMFRNAYGLDQYILCVGRLEARKNQLMLAYAARDLDVPVVFIGHDGNAGYANLVRSVAPGSAVFVPRIEPSDPLLASAFVGASAFCLPSWAEGAPLAALEAGAAGVPLVLSDRSSEREYFGDLAEYVSPVDVDGLRQSLTTAIGQATDTALRQKRIDHMKAEFTWDKHARETAEVYLKAQNHHKAKAKSLDVADLPPASETKIYVDLTTSWHHSGHPTGIARVEEKCLKSLLAVYGDRIVPIVWNSKTKNFLKLQVSDALAPSDLAVLTGLEKNGEAKLFVNGDTVEQGRVLVFGGAWIRNSLYIECLGRLKSQAGMNVTLLIHDLIQLIAGQLYPADVTREFKKHLLSMVRCADSFLAYSDATIADLSAYLKTQGELFKPIQKFRLGDMTSLEDYFDDKNDSELCQSLEGEDFVIYVSSIDPRKNHIHLVNVWRRLIKTRGNKVPQMLFVGRKMWGGDQILDLVQNEPALVRKVKFLQDVSDNELQWLYRNCLFTAYPSLHEGWGLPVAESLALGKVCIASNSTSTREISPRLTELLDPYDFKAWVDKINYFLDNPNALKEREAEILSDYTVIEWDETVTDIVSGLDTVSLRRTERPTVWPAALIEFTENSANPILADNICHGQWARREKRGRWSLGQQAKLSFRISKPASQLVLVRLALYALADPKLGVREMTFYIQDEPLGTYVISGKQSYLDLEIDTALLETDHMGFSKVDITAKMPEALSVSMFSDSNDGRLLGFHLGALVLGNNEAELDDTIPREGRLKATPHKYYMARLEKAALVSQASPKAQTDALQHVLDLLDEPVELPQTNLVFKALSLIKADTIVLKGYRKLTGRTHDALRRTINALVNENK